MTPRPSSSGEGGLGPWTRSRAWTGRHAGVIYRKHSYGAVILRSRGTARSVTSAGIRERESGLCFSRRGRRRRRIDPAGGEPPAKSSGTSTWYPAKILNKTAKGRHRIHYVGYPQRRRGRDRGPDSYSFCRNAVRRLDSRAHPVAIRSPRCIRCLCLRDRQTKGFDLDFRSITDFPTKPGPSRALSHCSPLTAQTHENRASPRSRPILLPRAVPGLWTGDGLEPKDKRILPQDPPQSGGLFRVRIVT